MAIKPLSSSVPIVLPNGAPTPEFQRAWQNLNTTAGVAPDTYVRKGQLSGWASPTGTVSRSTFVSYTAPGASASYSQAEMQAVMNHVQILSRTLAAMITDLKTAQLLTT